MPKKRDLHIYAPRVVGAGPAGITENVTKAIVKSLRKEFSSDGDRVVVKTVRFIPSSRTETGSGAFQVVANAVLDVSLTGETLARPRAFDSVATIERVGGKQRLQGLKIPAQHW